MAAIALGSGYEQLVERHPWGSRHDHTTLNRVVPAPHVEAESGSALPSAVSLLVEATDLPPVVTAPASSVDVLAKPSCVICDCGAGKPERPCDLGSGLATRQESADLLSRNLNRGHRPGICMFSTLAPLGRTLPPTQLFSVVADGRSCNAKSVSDLVHVQAGTEKLGNGDADLGHERMFSDGVVGLLSARATRRNDGHGRNRPANGYPEQASFRDGVIGNTHASGA